MNLEEKNTLNTLFYNAEEYCHFKNEDYKEFYDYAKSLVESIGSINDLELKKTIMNWDYKKRIYKSLNINSITVPYNKNIIINSLYGLMIRETGLHDENPHPFILHIEFNFNENLNTDLLSRMENVCNCFHIKKFHIQESKFDITDDIKSFLQNNNYELIYDISKKESLVIEGGKPKVRYIVNDNNINEFESYVSLCEQYKVKIMYVTNKCLNPKNINKYRSMIDEIIVKYTTKDFAIVSDEYIPGQHICIDNDTIYLKYNKDNVFTKFDKTDIIENVSKNLKLDMIDKLYINDKCINCEEKLLCMLGISELDCEEKIF